MVLVKRGEGLLYLCLNAQSSVFYNRGIFGELIKQILPLARQLPKRALGNKKYAPADRGGGG